MDGAKRAAMRAGHAVTIDVQYQFVDGYHIFTSDDVYGLYVASKDAQTAFDSVAPAIELLLKENDNLEGKIRPAVPFKDWLKMRQEPGAGNPPRQLVLRDTSYLLDVA